MFALNLPKRNTLGILLLLGFIWGTSFILIKRGLVALAAMEVASIRVLVGAIVLAPLALQASAWKELKIKDLPKLLIVGLLGTYVPGSFFAIAGSGLNSAASGALNALTPLFTLLFGIFLYKGRIKTLQVIGVIQGLFGALILAASKGGWQNLLDINGYAGFVILATICYALNIHLIKRWFTLMNPKTLSVFSIAQVGILALVYLIFDQHFTSNLFCSDSDFYLSVFYIVVLGAFSTGLANLLYMRMIQQTSPVFASSTTYIIPMFALLWGFWDNESLGLSHIIGVVTIITGILLINRGQ